MQLSYSLRLICFTLCAGVSLQMVLEPLAWFLAPHVLGQAQQRSARIIERSLFLLALFARVGPWVVVLTAWLPAYLHGEENRSPEMVGLVCLAGTAAILVALSFCWGSTLTSWVATQRCRRSSRPVGRTPSGLPVMLCRSDRLLLAAVGIVHPRVLVSASFLASAQVPHATMAIALRHEDAHIRQRDNLKLLLLLMLPHLPFSTGWGRSPIQLWRLAAEMAADEESAGGDAGDSVLLAELLVKVAKRSQERALRGAFALFSPAENLRIRVDRLLQNSAVDPQAKPFAPAGRLQLTRRAGIALSVGLFTMLYYGCAHAGHRSAEALLHLGLQATLTR